jgi:flavin reductase (DIM6/NTAB) family NADH-FMN oxidoreductase RutF
MVLETVRESAAFNSRFFPQHVTLLTFGENMMPMGYWTVISKEPFRFLLCMQLGNYTLNLLRKYQEAALNFMPWVDRERVVRAGHLSGRDGSKAERLGYTLRPAEVLQHTMLVEGAENIFETVVYKELEGLSREFGLFVVDVVAAHRTVRPTKTSPILYLSQQDFATLGERWRYLK